MIRVALSGAKGRMGNVLLDLIEADRKLKLCGAIERRDFEGEVYRGIPLCSRLSDLPEPPDVIIDFSSPEGTMALLDDAVSAEAAMVIGTTGFSPLQVGRIREAAKYIPIVMSPNMSLGVNILFKVVGEVARLLSDKDYDVEIYEAHHRFKKDAPSGTAMRLARIIADAMGKNPDTDLVFGRKGFIGQRRKDEIGVFSFRMGDTVGEHTVFFATLGERLEFTHRATSREAFAKGALVAAKWVVGKSPGLYSMFDVLQI